MNDVTLKTKLVWQCRRGMLELDVVLIPFLEKHFDSLNDEEQIVFTHLLEEADPDLYTWIMGFGVSDNVGFNNMIQLIRSKMGITS
jgi:antitoxin CptB